MKLIHLTAKRFESLSADSIYISSLTKQFAKILGNRYQLVNLNFRLNGAGFFHFVIPYLGYFFWLPYFLLFKVKTDNKTVLFASDPHLLWIVIFWKKLFSLKFRITSDWHMLHDDWKDRFISKNSDSLITTSEKLKKSLLEIGVPSEKALVVYGGVNLADFGNVDSSATKKKYGIPTDKVLIGYIGLFRTMGMEKGIDIMIRSLKFLNQDTLMVFVGGKKNEVSAYETLAGEIGVRNQCIFIEKIPDQKEIFNIEQAMNVLVIPYPDRPHFRNYGFPMKVYEYMAAEKPIVYSKLDLTEEILKDCGFTFVPDSEVSLADTIKYVISEENLGEVSEKATLAYEKLKEFTWENKARKIIEFLQRNG